ncbi:WIYLD domain [Dillenia turbinata]|uniref:WIYLD domain n=1 Tax=Dillenia turbinata TaxID=194707 RepID=A0AAN8ZAJ5_9MAGN
MHLHSLYTFPLKQSGRERERSCQSSSTMAPRRRASKVGLRRMDAAIDAMKPYGFPKSLVEKTVKRLLEVYDGDEGWPFIEEFSYKLLIEAILEPQEKEVDDLVQNEAVDGDDGPPQNEAADGDHAGPSSMAEISPAQEPPGPNEELAVIDADKERDHAPQVKRYLQGWRGSGLDESSHEAQVEDGTSKNFGSDQVVADEEEEINSTEDTPDMEQLPCITNRRSRPSYGWLGVENDEDDIVLLAPAPLGRAQGRRNKQKRKPRWDVLPGGA